MNHIIKLYKIAANGKIYGTEKGICRITGEESIGINFDKWVRKTFNDIGYLKKGTIISNEALFCFDESSEIVAKKTGKYYKELKFLYEGEVKKIEIWQNKNKTKDLPKPESIGYQKLNDGYYCLQRFRTYSHIIHNEKWYCLTKADKRVMYDLITSGAEIVSLNETGQKHMYFKHRTGFWQLDELHIIPNIDLFKHLHFNMCKLMFLGFSQKEIISGNYISYRIKKCGIEIWLKHEKEIKRYRKTGIFDFVSFMLYTNETKEYEKENKKPEKKKTSGGLFDLMKI